MTNRRPKRYPIKMQQLYKSTDLPLVKGNIGRWKLGPLVPKEAVVNRRAITKWYKRVEIVEEEK